MVLVRSVDLYSWENIPDHTKCHHLVPTQELTFSNIDMKLVTVNPLGAP